MSRQYNEDEDKLITWFKENIKNIVYGVIIGLSLILSFQYYENSKSNKQYELSLEYQNVIDQYEDSNYKEVIIVSEKFKKNYPTNIYTAMIGLYEAKIHHENKEYNSLKIKCGVGINLKDEVIKPLINAAFGDQIEKERK